MVRAMASAQAMELETCVIIKRSTRTLQKLRKGEALGVGGGLPKSLRKCAACYYGCTHWFGFSGGTCPSCLSTASEKKCSCYVRVGQSSLLPTGAASVPCFPSHIGVLHTKFFPPCFLWPVASKCSLPGKPVPLGLRWPLGPEASTHSLGVGTSPMQDIAFRLVTVLC